MTTRSAASDAFLELLPDPHVVVSPTGGLIGGNRRGLDLIRPDHPLLRMLASSAILPGVCRLRDGDQQREFSLASRDVEWEGAPARVLRFSARVDAHPAPFDADAHVRLLEGVLDALPTMVLLLDADGTIIEGNARWHVGARMNGLDQPHDAVGTSYLEVCDRAAAQGDRDAPIVARGLRDVLGGRAFAFQHEYEFIGPTGALESFQLSAHAIEGQGGAIVQHRMTSDLRREQRLHNEAYARFAAVFEFALDGMIIVDAERRFESANAAAARIAGLEREQLTQSRLDELLTDTEDDTVAAFWADLERDGERRSRLRLRRPDGTERVVELAARAGVVAGRHLLVMRDITGARLLEEQLRQAQKLQAIGQLTGGIAHDFNNVLTVILANAELLMLRESPTASREAIERERQHSVRELIAAAQRGRDMVRKLLAFGRKERILVGEHRLGHLITEIGETLRRVLPETITIRQSMEDCPPVLVDPNALHHILLNLATNARDAMPVGGRLEFRLGAVPAPDAADGNRRRFVQLTVSDTGIGMDENTLARVFEPFFTTKAVGEGTGLGLAMVYGLMEQMGGTVAIESRPGAGTTVRLRFATTATGGVPAVPPPKGPGVPSSANVPNAVRSFDRDQAPPAVAPHVLLVEDDPAIRSLAARILRSRGYDVVQAEDGAAAERLLRARAEAGEPTDLVLSDVVMPGGGGQTVARAVRRWAAATPVVWMTGYAFDGKHTGGTALAELPGPVLQKPWTIEALLQVVHESLPARAAEGETFPSASTPHASVGGVS